MNRTKMYAHKMYPHLVYTNLHSAYRKFDPVRGLDYKLHLNFRHKKNNGVVLKRLVYINALIIGFYFFFFFTFLHL